MYLIVRSTRYSQGHPADSGLCRLLCDKSGAPVQELVFGHDWGHCDYSVSHPAVGGGKRSPHWSALQEGFLRRLDMLQVRDIHFLDLFVSIF